MAALCASHPIPRPGARHRGDLFSVALNRAAHQGGARNAAAGSRSICGAVGGARVCDGGGVRSSSFIAPAHGMAKGYGDIGGRAALLRRVRSRCGSGYQMGAPPVVAISRAWAYRQRALARPADTGASVREPRRTARRALHASAGFIRPAPSRTDPLRQLGSRAAQPAPWRRTCTPEAARCRFPIGCSPEVEEDGGSQAGQLPQENLG